MPLQAAARTVHRTVLFLLVLIVCAPLGVLGDKGGGERAGAGPAPAGRGDSIGAPASGAVSPPPGLRRNGACTPDRHGSPALWDSSGPTEEPMPRRHALPLALLALSTLFSLSGCAAEPEDEAPPVAAVTPAPAVTPGAVPGARVPAEGFLAF